MGILKNDGNQTPSGKVGDVVYRRVGDKVIIAKAPVSYKKPDDEASEERFNSFSIVAFLGKTIGTSKTLKPIWKNCSVKGPGAYHKFLSVNRKEVTSDYGLKNFHLAPPENQFAVTSEISLDKNNFNVKVSAPGSSSGIKPDREIYMKLCGYVLMNGPNDGSTEKHVIGEIASEFSKTVLDSPLEFSFDLTKNTELKNSSMNTSTFFGVLVTFNSEYEPVRWSETFFKSVLLNTL